MLKKHFSICEIKIKIKTTTIGLKNELKYSPVSEGNKNNVQVLIKQYHGINGIKCFL